MSPPSPIAFMKHLSHSASILKELKEHDGTLANIGQPTCRESTSSSAFSVDTATTAQTPAEHSSSTLSAAVCSFEHNELRQLGRVGSGTYCKVDMVSHESSPEILAQKAIDTRRLRCRKDLNNAATELANEAKILSGLNHENIIKLRGVSSERFSESFVSGKGGYFLIVDILNETLRERLNKEIKMEKQEQQSQRNSSYFRPFTGRFRKSAASQSSLNSQHRFHEYQKLYHRIDETVVGIARGMKYLHSENIVLRDLKPDNIGYDNIMDGTYGNDEALLESTVKLFDFGMASKIDECNHKEICGSPRYMAPEVMLGKGYTLAVDVYSFGVVLYELCSLKRPFEESLKRQVSRRKRSLPKDKNGAIRQFYSAVVGKKLKPWDNLEKDVCCPRLRSLITACCQHDPSKRPTFSTIQAKVIEIFSPTMAWQKSCTDIENLRDRDCTGRRSVSIEFACKFELESCDGATPGGRETHSFP